MKQSCEIKSALGTSSGTAIAISNDANKQIHQNPWSHKATTVLNKNSDDFIIHKQMKTSAHAFLYCKSSAVLFKHISMKYGILMQLRFDGTLGFPGGFLEKEELPVVGLNRELTEEIGLEAKYYLSEENYFCSWATQKHVDHFYVKQFTEEDFTNIEKRILLSKDWGGETLGVVRVPVHHMKKHTQVDPFAAFLCHRYISNAKEQLIESILHENILSRPDVLRLWDVSLNETTC